MSSINESARSELLKFYTEQFIQNNIETSPTLVNLLNKFTGSLSYSLGASNGTDASINDLTKNGLPTLAHELTHASHSDYQNNSRKEMSSYNTAYDYANSRALAEGEAIYNEFQVAKELGIAGSFTKPVWEHGQSSPNMNKPMITDVNNIINSGKSDAEKIQDLADLNKIMLSNGQLSTPLYTYDEANILGYLKNRYLDNNLHTDYKEVVGVELEWNTYEAKSLGDAENRFYGENENDLIINTFTRGTVVGQQGKGDLMYGGGGNDTIIGNSGKDIILGGTGDDKLFGWENDDILGGNSGNDTLEGGKGNDTLVGGTGFDTYILEGFDTLFDSDGQGKLQYANGAVIPTLIRANPNTWTQNTTDYQYIAHQQDQDLILDQINQKTGEKTETIIQKYFENTDPTAQSITKLSLTLETEKTQDPPAQNTSNPLIVKPEYPAYINTSGLTAPITIIGSQKADLVMANFKQGVTIDLMAGSDMIYGSTTKDIIYGGSGNDIIYGSLPVNETPTVDSIASNDQDKLFGGTGTDFIYGGLGNDDIYGNDINSHLLTESSSEKGDWLMGATGNDKIYGSASIDFLQGGKDQDMIFGGAGNDVILGDGNIRFGTQSKTGNLAQQDPHFDLEPVDTGHPLVPPTYIPILVQPTPQTATIDYSFPNGKLEIMNLPTLYYRDEKSFDWKVNIDTTTGGYALDTQIAPSTREIAVDSDNALDMLFGGAGNDLIMGQYGDDILMGEDGDDILWGDDKELDIQGNDWLEGGSGADKLFGGKGFDTYTFRKADLATTHDIKTIQDTDNLGRILLDGIDLSSLVFIQDKTAKQIYRNADLKISIAHIDSDYQITSDDNTAFAGIIKIQDASVTPFGLQLKEANNNQAPTIAKTLTNQLITANQDFTLVLGADLFNDPEGDTLTYTISQTNGNPLPSWLNFNPSTNTLAGIAPDNTHLSLKITATDTAGETVTQTFNLDSNSKPMATVESIDHSLSPDLYMPKFKLNPYFKDADGDTLTYQASMENGDPLINGFKIHNEQSYLYIDASVLEPGNYNLLITATDSHGLSTSTTAHIHVQEPYKMPTIIDYEYFKYDNALNNSMANDMTVAWNTFEPPRTMLNAFSNEPMILS